ncbi:MAG: hypothetical protein DRI70_07790 [Bacteroidetes bacterium]|nr:MAG: hypothetical protein DRI70_07790 [Bacteroidota bacterium]
MSVGPAGDLYVRSAQELIKQKLSEDDHRIYIKIRDLSSTATTLYRESLLEESRNCLKRAWDYLDKHAKSEELILLGKSRIAQTEAYLDFLQKDFKQAKSLLQTSLESDEVLETDYEYSVFHVQRLHNLHLQIRIDFETGNPASAIELCEKIIQYLTGNLDDLLVGNGWGGERVKNTPAIFRNSILSQIVGEVGTHLTKQSAEIGRELFMKFPGWKLLAGNDFLKEIYEWGSMKEAFLNNEHEKFLELCAAFLKKGPMETLLWHTTVLDLCACCKALRPSQTKEFLKEVAEDAKAIIVMEGSQYIAPTEIGFKQVVITKDDAIPVHVLPTDLRKMLENNSDFSVTKTRRKSIELPRNFHAYDVGLPRSGTSSIASLFGNYRSRAEFKERESVEHIVAWKDGHISRETLRKYVLNRHRVGGLEMDPASFNHFYMSILVEEFPEAKFIFTIRDCYTWVNSFSKMISRWRKHFHDVGYEMPGWMLDYGRILFGKFDWNWLSSYQTVQSNLPELVGIFVQCWAKYNRSVLELLPPERSLIIRTHELSQSLDRIAEFIGVPGNRLTTNHHVNISPDGDDLLSNFNRGEFDELCSRYGSDIMERVFSENPMVV